MPFLDDRGRLFGRINLIDAIVALILLALIPLGYVSWMLFRTPPPVIGALTPPVFPAHQEHRVRLQGENLRPYLRVFFGTVQGRYFFESPRLAEIEVPALLPGTYDLVLFDESAEMDRRHNAVTVTDLPPPIVKTVTPRFLEFTRAPQHLTLIGERFPPTLRVSIGGEPALSFTQVSATRADVTVGPQQPGTFDLVLSSTDGKIELARVPGAVTVMSPVVERVTPPVLEYSREPRRVDLYGKHFEPNIRVFVGWQEVKAQFDSPQRAYIAVPPMMAGRYDVILIEPLAGRELARFKNGITIRPMQVVDLRIRVRFLTYPEVLALVKPGQQGMTPRMEPTMPPAVLLSYEVGRELTGAWLDEDPTTPRELRVGPRRIVEGVLRVTGTQTAEGWQYDGQIIKAGGRPFEFRTPTYMLRGDILSVEVLSIHAR